VKKKSILCNVLTWYCIFFFLKSGPKIVLLVRASVYAAYDISHVDAVAQSAHYSAKSIFLPTVPRFKDLFLF